MWPLTGRDLVDACGGDAPPDLDGVSIAGVTLGERAAERDDVFVALREDGFDGHEHVAATLAEGAALAVVARDAPELRELSSELRARCIVVPNTLRAFRAIASALRRRFSFPVVAVGGSNGKTTTKDMIAALLEGAGARVTKTPETMNGWSGLPLTLVQREHAASAPPDALVVEIGIDARGAMAEHVALVDPDIAVLTTLSAEHLAGLGTVDEVVREETLLLSSPHARRVLHVADGRIREAMTKTPPRPADMIVGVDGDDRERGGAFLAYDVRVSAPESCEVALSYRPAGAERPEWQGALSVPMAGRHNGANAALAFATALVLGRSPGELARGLDTFVAPAMRCELRTLPNGCLLVDDAYNANPASTTAALELVATEAWRQRARIVVLGDMLDLGAETERLHLELVAPLRALAEQGARILLYGDALRKVHDALGANASAHAPEAADPRTLLATIDSLEGAVVLVKGSRSMRLERVVAEIVERCTPRAPRLDLSPYRDRFVSACVTGTNGKTTTTSLVAAIVEASGEPSCRVTTLGAWVDGEQTATEPTGEAFLHTVALAAARGVRTLAVETTSHALADGFAREWPARVAVFTNLSRDHLDYHGTPEQYLAAKAQLFVGLPAGGAAIFNVADPSSALLDEITPSDVRRFGYAAREPDPACAAIPISLSVEAVSITVDADGTHALLAPSPLADALGGRIDLRLVGAAHVENALGAALAAHALGYSAEAIRAGLARFGGVPGRFEIVARAPLVVVDYAHTPDALARTLAVARSLVGEAGRVHCVFGCGGERDPGKRKEMGVVAASAADAVVITNDNPRSEDPEAIASSIEEGAREVAKSSKERGRVERILDRRAAIDLAVGRASLGDIVVIAGKGHEKTQTIGDREVPFDDVEIAREAARERKGVDR